MCADNFSEERSLILRLIEGDEDAFCELYATYKNRLIYFAMRFLKSREYAEDVFQDAFTVVWQSRRFINPDASFSSYLYTIMRNRILNQLRNAANEEKLKDLKSATKLFSVLLASKRPLITELADKLRLKYPLLPTISPCPTMRLEAIRSIIPISCRRYPKSV